MFEVPRITPKNELVIFSLVPILSGHKRRWVPAAGAGARLIIGKMQTIGETRYGVLVFKSISTPQKKKRKRKEKEIHFNTLNPFCEKFCYRQD